MRRVRAAITPAAFFVGMALICASLAEFQRFPVLEGRLDTSDLSGGGGSALEKLTPEVAPSLLAAALLSVLGLGLTLLRRHLLGGLLLAGSAIAPSIVLTLAVLRLRGSDAAFFTCMGTHRSELPGVLISAQTMLLGLTAVIALAWLVVQRREPGHLQPGSFIALGITLMMVATTAASAEYLAQFIGHQSRFWGESSEVLRLRFLENAVGIGLFVAAVGFSYGRPESRLVPLFALLLGAALVRLGNPGNAHVTELFYSFDFASQPPGRFLAFIAALGVAGVVLSFLRPLYCSRAVSLLVLVVGAMMSVPALAIAHDEKQEFHYSNVYTWEEMTRSPTTWCEPTEVLPSLRIQDDELVMDGVVLTSEAIVLGAIRDQVRRDRELRSQANSLPGPDERVFNFEVDRSASMQWVSMGLRALASGGIDAIEIITIQETKTGLWTRQADHQHVCGARVEFAPDGQPLSDFPDWPSLVRAAYQAKGKLRLNPPVSAED